METELLEQPQCVAKTKPAAGLVLIVDDEEQNRMLLHDSLEAHHYEIEEAENGMRALEKIAARPPDVVLLDVLMPGMDGFEVCEQLKKDPATASIPVLMVTAFSERQERLMGIAVGANDFLRKPVDLQDLTLRVRNAVSTKRLYDQLQLERQKSETLLRNVLPGRIAERMKGGEANIVDAHTDVGVLVADLVGFTHLAAHIGPEQVLALLNELFTAFDGLVAERGLEKIKTIGDAYMVASGLSPTGLDHPYRLALLGLDMLSEVERFNASYRTSLRLRIGIATGPVVAGVIGRTRFSYDVWGDTVNLACQLEGCGKPGTINVSEATFERLKDFFSFEMRATSEIKGRDTISFYTIRSGRGSS